MVELKQANNVDLLTILKDGFNTMEKEGADCFEYIIGEVKGGKLKIVFEPDDMPVCSDTVVIDGVDGFGYTLVYEDEA